MHRSSRSPRKHPHARAIDDVDALLDALTREQLLSVLRDFLGALKDAEQRAVLGRLIRLATQSASAKANADGARDPALLDDISDFLRRARDYGEGSPAEADALFDRCARILLEGNLTGARQAYELLLRALGEGELYLGQEEMADEVLETSLTDAGARYLFAVYETAPLHERPKELWQALSTEWLEPRRTPLAEMERVTGRPLSELDAFLPRWIEWLRGRHRRPARAAWASWSTPHDSAQDWLREAVGRAQGGAGLKQLALERGDPETFRAWVARLAEAARWKELQGALDAASRDVPAAFERATFADALARIALRRRDRRGAQVALQRAWSEEPTLPRLLRWLAFASKGATDVERRARAALHEAPRAPLPLRALLHVLLGEYEEAASMLERALEHPSPVVLPALLTAVAGPAPESSATASLWNEDTAAPFLEEVRPSHLLSSSQAPDIVHPGARAMAEAAAQRHPMNPVTREAVLSSLRTAALKQTHAVLKQQRRQVYPQAARVLVACAETLARVGRAEEGRQLLTSTLRAFTPYSAFQREVRTACSTSEVVSSWRALWQASHSGR